METDFDLNPGASQSLGYRLADLYVALGRWPAAYRLMAPLATRDADEPTLLRASSAAAWRGEVYPGQRAYLVRSVIGHSSATEDRREYLPQGEGPTDVLTLSLLATMCEAASHGDDDAVRLYGGLALRRDPGNPLVCYHFANDAMYAGRPAEAIALLNKGLPRTRGDWAFGYRLKLREARGITPAEATAMRAKADAAAKALPKP